MIAKSIWACETSNADLGIVLDTDADRCAFIVPSDNKNDGGGSKCYEPLNCNRLIAVLGVIFAGLHLRGRLGHIGRPVESLRDLVVERPCVSSFVRMKEFIPCWT